jgi:O-antigen ligase
MPTVAEMAMSRSSGIARFAAVPAIIAFSRILQGKRSRRLLWLFPFVVFTAVVITLQSRGAVFGFAAAICLVLLVHRAREKMVFLVVATLVAALWVDSAIPDRTVEYIYRGQDRVEFLTLTGRTYTWAKGWELFKESPIVGLGPQADRYSLRGAHMHNSYLYALTQSGLLGTIPFVAAWLLAWSQLARLVRKRNEMSTQHRQLLTEAGAVFLFFTVRSIPESTAAFFGVDLLIVVPLLAYFDILHRHYSLSPLTDTEQAIEAQRLPWARPPYRLWKSSRMPLRRPGLKPRSSNLNLQP